MPKLEEHTTVEDGSVMGRVSTSMVGSDVTIEICSVEEWEEMTDKEAEELALEVMLQNVDWNY